MGNRQMWNTARDAGLASLPWWNKLNFILPNIMGAGAGAVAGAGADFYSRGKAEQAGVPYLPGMNLGIPGPGAASQWAGAMGMGLGQGMGTRVGEMAQRSYDTRAGQMDRFRRSSKPGAVVAEEILNRETQNLIAEAEAIDIDDMSVDEPEPQKKKKKMTGAELRRRMQGGPLGPHQDTKRRREAWKRGE